MGLADAIPGPIKGLLQKNPPPKVSRRSRTEGAEFYRILGVTPDADYLEVLDACDRLKEKYKGNKKQIIKLDKAKDDIMALRLRQASEGNLKTTEAAKDVDQYMTAKKKYLKKKNSAFKVPSWAKGWFEVPDRVYFNQVAYRHGAFAILSVILPSAVTGLMFFGGATCMANMMNRNAPDLKRDDNNQIAEVRLPARKTVALSMATIALCYFVGALVGTFFCRLVGEYYILIESWKALFVHLNFFLASLFISTWRDPEDGPKIAKRRGMGGRRD